MSKSLAPNKKDDAIISNILEELSDPDAAIAKAHELLADEDQSDEIISRIRQGRKRHPGFGLHKLRPLEGCTYPVATKIRKIVGLRYSGFPDALTEKMFGWSEGYIIRLETRLPKPFQQAREELLKHAVTEYNQNVAFARAALSESAFKAVDTLVKVMSDPDAKAGERKGAAESVLKLTLGVRGEHPGDIATDVINAFGEQLRGIISESKHGNYIQDIEYEEVEDVESLALAPR